MTTREDCIQTPWCTCSYLGEQPCPFYDYISRRTTTPIQLVHQGDRIMSPYGVVSTARDGLGDVATVSIWVIAAGLQRRLPVCAFAQLFLPGGIGYVTRDGMFVLQNSTRRVVYELFPAVFPDGTEGTLVYLAVKRSDSNL